MKKLLTLFSFAILIISCNSENKKVNISESDTLVVRKVLPPFAAVAESPTMSRGFAALSAVPLETVIDFRKRADGKYDTVVRTRTEETKTVAVTYPLWTEVVKVYREATTPTTPTDPGTSKGYLSLPTSGALDLSGKSNVIVENKRFTGISGVVIKLYGGANNITIRNCYFDGNSSTGELVELENASNITIDNCLFEGGYAGVYAVGSKNIKIINSQFVNMRIRWSGSTFQGRGVFAQFNGCDGFEVSGCKGENFPEADPEDMISAYKSSNGVIKNNIFRGNPQSGWSASGGGIIAGDNGGNNVVIDNNTLMTPGNYGTAIAGGSNMKVTNNKIYSERNAVSNNPLYVWAQSGATMSNVTVTGNRVYWVDKNGAKNNGWNAGNGTNIIWQNPTAITFAEMNVPVHLIDFLTPTELLKVRGK